MCFMVGKFVHLFWGVELIHVHSNSCIAFDYHVYLICFHLILSTANPASFCFALLFKFFEKSKAIFIKCAIFWINLFLCDSVLLSNFGKNHILWFCSRELWTNSRRRILPRLQQLHPKKGVKSHFQKWDLVYTAFNRRVRCPKQNERRIVQHSRPKLLITYGCLKGACALSDLTAFVEPSELRFGQGQSLPLQSG